jgi:dTDP-glucose 4,6-dehydratase/UDP-glucose 4-epimerase
VGSDKPVSILNLAEKIRNIIAPSKKIKIHGDTDYVVGNFSRDYYVPNINRAKNELSLNVWIDLDQAINRLIDSATRHG